MKNWTEMEPEVLRAFAERFAERAADLPWLNLESVRPSRAVVLPLLPEYSKDPLDADVIVEDILDADLIG